MIFESLYIKSFGKLSGKTIAFSEGINIIEGNNESGKSTICAFIRFMFYGLPTHDKKRYIGWDTSLAAGSLTFFDNGGHYRIEREVIMATGSDGKDFFREKCAVYDADTNAIFSKTKSPGELFFGVSSFVFESTVLIRQTQSAKVGGSALGEEAENILFSGNERLNTGKALEKLDKARSFLLHKNHKGGKIAELEAQRNEKAQLLEQAQQENGDIIDIEGSLRLIKEEKENTDARIAVLREELEEYERYTIKKAYLTRKAEKEKLAQARAELERLYEPEEHEGIAVSSPDYIAMLEKKQSALNAAMSRYHDAKKEMDDANQKISDMSEKLEIFERLGAEDKKHRDALIANLEIYQKNLNQCQLIGIICLLFSLFSVALTLMLGLAPSIPVLFRYFAIAACVLFAAAAFYLLMIRRASYARAIRRQCQPFNCASYAELMELIYAASEDEAYMLAIRGARNEKNTKFAKASDTLDAINAEILTILRDARFEITGNTFASLQEALEKCRTMYRKITELESDAAERKARIESIEADLSAYSKEYLRSACYEEYDEDAMADFNYPWKKRELETLSGTLRNQTERLHQYEVELASLRAIYREPSAIAEEIHALDTEIETLSQKWSAYMLAIESLEAASGKMREGISPKIAKNAAKLFAMVSDGKYTELTLDTDFIMSFSDGTSMHSTDLLSAGTGDLAYLCLRIALIDLLYQRSVAPFLFDETFVRIDDIRIKKLLTLIARYADSGYQSIIFTCHNREKRLMDDIGAYHHLYI